MAEVVLCLDTVRTFRSSPKGEKRISAQDYCKQWDELLGACKRAGTNEKITVLLWGGGVCTDFIVDPRTLYITSGNANISYTAGVKSEIPLRVGEMLSAISDLKHNQGKAGVKSKVLTIFAISEAARFEDLRFVLYGVMIGFDLPWEAVHPLLNLWDKIREASKKGVTDSISHQDLLDYIEMGRRETDPQKGINGGHVEKALDEIIPFIERAKKFIIAEKRAEEEAERKAEEEAKRKAEEEAKRKAEEEAKRKAEEEAKRKAEEEAKRKAEEEKRSK